MTYDTTETRAKVWALESGKYPDEYTIHGIFSSEANARRVFDALGFTDEHSARIVAMPLDPVVAELDQGFTLYEVHLSAADGTPERVYRAPLADGHSERYHGVKGLANPDRHVIGFVWAQDEQHATKKVAAWRLEHLARQAEMREAEMREADTR